MCHIHICLGASFAQLPINQSISESSHESISPFWKAVLGPGEAEADVHYPGEGGGAGSHGQWWGQRGCRHAATGDLHSPAPLHPDVAPRVIIF